MKSSCILFLLFLSSLTYGQLVWVETELFDDRGGWISEAQFVDQMGSPYLMAHGLEQPVEDAQTIVKFPETEEYHFWVRTKDWVLTDVEGSPVWNSLPMWNTLLSNRMYILSLIVAFTYAMSPTCSWREGISV